MSPGTSQQRRDAQEQREGLSSAVLMFVRQQMQDVGTGSRAAVGASAGATTFPGRRSLFPDKSPLVKSLSHTLNFFPFNDLADLRILFFNSLHDFSPFKYHGSLGFGHGCGLVSLFVPAAGLMTTHCGPRIGWEFYAGCKK